MTTYYSETFPQISLKAQNNLVSFFSDHRNYSIKRLQILNSIWKSLNLNTGVNPEGGVKQDVVKQVL